MKVFKVTLTTSTDLYVESETSEDAKNCIRKRYWGNLVGADEYNMVAVSIVPPENYKHFVIKAQNENT